MNRFVSATVSAKDGLLWRNGEIIELPEADAVAKAHGYQYAEQLVRALQGDSKYQRAQQERMVNSMTPVQARFVELERQREGAKQFFKDLAEATLAVAEEIDIDGYFQDDQGVVYKIVEPKGRWVDFETISYVRTRREGEEKGSLSQKEALAAGFGPF